MRRVLPKEPAVHASPTSRPLRFLPLSSSRFNVLSATFTAWIVSCALSAVCALYVIGMQFYLKTGGWCALCAAVACRPKMTVGRSPDRRRSMQSYIPIYPRLRVRKREPLTALCSHQGGPKFLHPRYPTAAMKEGIMIEWNLLRLECLTGLLRHLTSFL